MKIVELFLVVFHYCYLDHGAYKIYILVYVVVEIIAFAISCGETHKTSTSFIFGYNKKDILDSYNSYDFFQILWK